MGVKLPLKVGEKKAVLIPPGSKLQVRGGNGVLWSFS